MDNIYLEERPGGIDVEHGVEDPPPADAPDVPQPDPEEDLQQRPTPEDPPGTDTDRLGDHDKSS